tara:strand:+ start:140 stop:325 length:186 start_codon:yes stop_codon:yes gene_type:complete
MTHATSVTITPEDDVFGGDRFVVTVTFSEGDDMHFAFATSRIASAFAERIADRHINTGGVA